MESLNRSIDKGLAWISDALTTDLTPGRTAALQQREAEIQRLVQAGAEAYDRHEYAHAAALFSECRRLSSYPGLVATPVLDYFQGIAAINTDQIRAALAFGVAGRKRAREQGSVLGEVRCAYVQYHAEWALGDLDAAFAHCSEALVLTAEPDSRTWEAPTHLDLGGLCYERGDPGSARSHYEEALAGYRQGGSASGVAYAMCAMGSMVARGRDNRAAHDYLKRSFAILREVDDRWNLAAVLYYLGKVARYDGDVESALSHHRLSLRLRRALRVQHAIVNGLERCAGLAACTQDGVKAARLLGAAAAIRERLGCPVSPDMVQEHEEDVLAACALTGRQGFSRECAVGRAMSWDDALDYALRAE